MYITTFVVAFIIDWLTTLVIFAVGPLSCLTMSFMAKVILNVTNWKEHPLPPSTGYEILHIKMLK